MDISRKEVMDAFRIYTDHYNSSDPKIKLKIDHTYRVADLCEQIVKGEKLYELYGQDAIDLAWASGMLHDVGRFEQIRQYGTFSDADSVDHATLGADLLFGKLADRGAKRLETFLPLVEDNLLETFVPNFKERMSEDQIFMLELAIRNHSLYRIQPNLTKEQVMYCDVLRDADKVDIFRVNCETPLEDIYNVSREDLVTASVTPEVKQAFEEKHAVLRALKKTSIDHVVGHASLTFELVYPTSLELARKQGYLKQMLEFESQNPETVEWFAHMRESLKL